MSDDKDLDSDYIWARDQYYSLAEKGNEAIDLMMDLAKETDHPRAFEVLSTMIKQNAELSDKLMALQKTKKEIEKKESLALPDQPAKVTNNMFVGSTSELQKIIQEKQAEKELN